MAFFAKLESNVVVDVVVVNNSDMEDNSGVPSEAIGIGFLTKRMVLLLIGNKVQKVMRLELV